MKEQNQLNDSTLEKVVGGVTTEESKKDYEELYWYLKAEHDKFVSRKESLANYKRAMSILINIHHDEGRLLDREYRDILGVLDMFAGIPDYL